MTGSSRHHTSSVPPAVLRRCAYYEYICRRAGIDVQYVAEQFENDGSPVSTIVKGVKRAMAGNMPISLAIRISENPEDEQRALQEAYESKQLRGNRLLHARRLIEIRRRSGKQNRTGPRTAAQKAARETSSTTNVRDIMKAYQKEVDRKLIMVRKAEVITQRGVPIERLAQVLGNDPSSVLRRKNLLDGMCPEAQELLKDKMVAMKLKFTKQVQHPVKVVLRWDKDMASSALRSG
jgi:hypothetical protein